MDNMNYIPITLPSVVSQWLTEEKLVEDVFDSWAALPVSSCSSHNKPIKIELLQQRRLIKKPTKFTCQNQWKKRFICALRGVFYQTAFKMMFDQIPYLNRHWDAGLFLRESWEQNPFIKWSIKIYLKIQSGRDLQEHTSHHKNISKSDTRDAWSNDITEVIWGCNGTSIIIWKQKHFDTLVQF